ncbi:MAG TPA: nuclear transport factor 2 family protein [Pseudonocardiaceae bacterium]
MFRNDHQELTNLVARLRLMLDEKRFEQARSVFTEDASVRTAGGEARGIDALVTQARRTHRADTSIQSFVANPLVTVAGDTATIAANLLLVFARPDERRLIGERYHLTAARTPEGWRISHVESELLWESTLA